MTRHNPDCGCDTPAPDPALLVAREAGFTRKEAGELFPDVTDPTLMGERIAALTSAWGIPPCECCDKRRAWLNKAHAWLRSTFNG